MGSEGSKILQNFLKAGLMIFNTIFGRVEKRFWKSNAVCFCCGTASTVPRFVTRHQGKIRKFDEIFDQIFDQIALKNSSLFRGRIIFDMDDNILIETQKIDIVYLQL